MHFKSYFKEALANVLNSKLRSFLTVLGVFVGTASVVALISGGRLATEHALAQFKILGTDLLAVSIEEARYEPSEASDPTAVLHLQDIRKIEKSSSSIIAAAPYTTGFGNLSYDGIVLQGAVIGAAQSLQKIIKIEMAKGRFVSSYDGLEMYCVIGDGLAKNLKEIGVLRPVGKQIKVQDYYFTIIGIAKPWMENMFVNTNINSAVIIPIETSLLLNKYIQIRDIIFRLIPGTNIAKVEHEIDVAIKRMVPGKKLFFRSASELVSSMEKQSQTLTLFLSFIGGISLVVGGIGVMNIMLVSVIERRREIGIRIAVGARRKDIQMMFLTESIVLTLFGGMLGIIAGEMISLLAAVVSGWKFHFFLFPPLAGFLVSVLVGIFFGFYPAYSASQLNPIEILRSD